MNINEDQITELAEHILNDDSERHWFEWNSWSQCESNPFLSVYCTAFRVFDNDDREIFKEFYEANMDYPYGRWGDPNADRVWVGPDIGDLIEYIEEGFDYTTEEAEALVKEFLPNEFKKHKNNSDYLVEM